mmetsp:Transcript_4652/g.4082  ORF Transcript_4652/g.4082 Transcript_4652/m.4082 type:complete len:262 (-) Transcript_4652:40-825(-)
MLKVITTIFSILSLSLSADLDSSELECRAVRWQIAGLAEYVQPLDVCYSVVSSIGGTTSSVSYWYYCSKRTGTAKIATYQNADCSGYPIAQATAEQTYSIAGYTVDSACGTSLPECDYATIRSYSAISDCDTDTSDDLEAWIEVPYIANYCMNTFAGSYQYTCDSSGGSAYELWSGQDCEGTAMTSLAYESSDYSIDCDSYSIGATSSIRVECGTANFAGLLNDDEADTSTLNTTPTSGVNHIAGVYIMVYGVLMGLYYLF